MPDRRNLKGWIWWGRKAITGCCINTSVPLLEAVVGVEVDLKDAASLGSRRSPEGTSQTPSRSHIPKSHPAAMHSLPIPHPDTLTPLHIQSLRILAVRVA